MTDWEAKYKALAAGLSKNDVEAAELIVEAGIRIANSTTQPLSEVLEGLVYIAHRFKKEKR